jgi:DNA-binding transcriptional regulator YdaS (Cro superfamily)
MRAMEQLRTYLKTLTREEQGAFAQRCGTTLGYLRKAMSIKTKLGESIVIAMERESAGAVTVEGLRPDVDWAYIRGTESPRQSA